mmetsp:Transcript_19229/g.41678  ORF Transcript_19229/g.41678 Transcript_19229/m.41678 type:complete len:344 (+) Transcript_19229:44-1075(+)
MNVVNFLRLLFLIEGVSGLVSPQPRSTRLDHRRISTVPTAIASADLQSELDAQGLGLCHGVLHASGVRCLADLKSLTSEQLESMRLKGAVGTSDYERLLPFVSTEAHDVNKPNNLSTSVDGAFDRPPETPHNFDWKVIENDIFRGQLFTVEQCEQINRMAEYHAYRGIGTIGAGWTNEIYTLTAQHLQCKEIPGFLSTTRHIFDQLQRSLYTLYPGRIRPDSICYESDGEPHLVKYNGAAKGTELHTDNSEFVYITVNVMLSDPADFTGGGTHFTEIDQTIKLKQGEMLLHLGDMEHAGVEIKSGVRRVLIAFLACTWEDNTLNIEKLDQAREVCRQPVEPDH